MKRFTIVLLIIKITIICAINNPRCVCERNQEMLYDYFYDCTLINVISIIPQCTEANNLFVFRIITLKSINASDILDTALEKYLDLRKVFFNNCSITKISRNMFIKHENLINLDFSNNIIEILPNRVFADLENLNTLDLSNNLIEEIGVLYGPTKLISLNLANNKIHKLSENAFTGLEHIKFLYLNNNEISIIGENTFTHNTFLETLDLSFNKIILFENIDLPETMRRLSLTNNSIKSLQVSKNISVLNAANNLINNITFGNFSALKNLNLSTNSFTNIFDVVNQMINLVSLDVSFNYIGKLNISTFMHLQKLEILNLENTTLSGLNYGIFSKQINLRFLDISYNHLKTIDFNHFLSLTSLEKIFIDGNSLHEIDSIMEMLPTIDTIGLSNNNFNCSYLAKIIKKFNSRNVNISVDKNDLVQHYPNINGISCNVSEADLNIYPIEYPQHTITHNNPLDSTKLNVLHNKINDLSSQMDNINALHSKLSNNTDNNYIEILTKVEVIANKQTYLENQIMNLESLLSKVKFSILFDNTNATLFEEIKSLATKIEEIFYKININSIQLAKLKSDRESNVLPTVKKSTDISYEHLKNESGTNTSLIEEIKRSATKIEEIIYKIDTISVQLAKLKSERESNVLPMEKISTHIGYQHFKNDSEAPNDLVFIKILVTISFVFGFLFMIFKLVVCVMERKYKNLINMLRSRNRSASSTTLNTVTTNN